MSGGSVLVIDDEDDVRRLVSELLIRRGHVVFGASSGREGLRVFHRSRPDAVVLDVAMPDLDGWETLERIRELSDVPVLMLTAKAGELEKVRGLRGGADDYLTKPFGRQELVARVEVMLRRATASARREPADLYSDQLLRVDFGQRLVAIGDDEVALTPLEFRLLAAFVRNADQVLSHDQLVELAWGDDGSGSRNQVKLYVGYVRRKLGPFLDGRPDPIETLRGFGYRYRR